MKPEINRQKKERRHKRVRMKVSGTKDRPRLCVFKSAKHIYAQLINDENNKTLIEVSDLKIKKTKSEGKYLKTDRAKEVGKLIAKSALAEKIDKVVFDRGGYKYHGRVKALAEGAREGGLQF